MTLHFIELPGIIVFVLNIFDIGLINRVQWLLSAVHKLDAETFHSWEVTTPILKMITDLLPAQVWDSLLADTVDHLYCIQLAVGKI